MRFQKLKKKMKLKTASPTLLKDCASNASKDFIYRITLVNRWMYSARITIVYPEPAQTVTLASNLAMGNVCLKYDLNAHIFMK